MSKDYTQAEAHASLRKLQKRLGFSVGEDVSPPLLAKPTARPRYVARYAAIAAAILIAVLGVKYIPILNPAHTDIPVSKTYSTANGQRATITLADGSQAILAPATTMRVSGRDVDLKGEAVFTVTHSSQSAFTVHANGAAIQVLGTRFGVRAYDDLRVAVVDGRVSVASAVLSAGDVANIKGNTTTVTQNIDVASLLSWTNGDLTFTDTPLSTAIRDMERWFNVSIHITDPELFNYPISATLSKNTPAQLAEILADILNARAELHGHEIVISKRR